MRLPALRRARPDESIPFADHMATHNSDTAALAAALETHLLTNVAQLGKFIRKAATQDFASNQSVLRVASGDLVGNLLQTLTSVVAGVDEAQGESQDSCSDPTETELTINVYATHFDLANHFVQMSTSDLLKLSNLLYRMVNTGAKGAGNSVLFYPDCFLHRRRLCPC